MFTRDIEPIVLARCAPCHREGGSAQFALASYDAVASRARVIEQVIRTGYMPPWLPEEGSETFAGARRLNALETRHRPPLDRSGRASWRGDQYAREPRERSAGSCRPAERAR